MKRWFFGTTLLALSFWAAFPAFAQDDLIIAHVSRIKQGATVVRSGAPQPLDLTTDLRAHDQIATAADARLEITFNDGTTLTLGENARLTLDNYVYDPAGANNALALSVTQGAFLFVSGLMGKEPERDMSLSTPLATIGIRGTTFWGGALDNPLDVLLLDGKIDVRAPQGTVHLNEAGQGTSILTDGAALLSARVWPQGKRERAFATVAF